QPATGVERARRARQRRVPVREDRRVRRIYRREDPPVRGRGRPRRHVRGGVELVPGALRFHRRRGAGRGETRRQGGPWLPAQPAAGTRGLAGLAAARAVELPGHLQSDCLPETFERLQSALAGRYAIERELGHGAMATVFLAQDVKHRRPVALKVLRPDVAATVGPERFVRDIKPENILLAGGHAVVADFGIAHAVSEAGGDTLTATGMTLGTPAYMSPEQAAGANVDGRSDQYALACVVYEMLSGEPPFTGA